MAEYILEIRDEDLGLESLDVEKYNIREAARAVIFNDEGKIALLNVGKYEYHKLPGGGIEDGEDWVKAVHREALEEVGASIKIRDDFLVKVLEFRSQISLKHISSCCISDAVDKIAEISPEKDEIDSEQLPIWVSIDEAIDIMKKDKPDNYHGKFMVRRDLAFLEAVKEEIS